MRKFAEDVVEPKSREMDENEKMDPSIIKGLFDQGVSFPSLLFPLRVLADRAELRSKRTVDGD